jgi:hypothetical protein
VQGLGRVDVRSHTPKEAVSGGPSALHAGNQAFKHICTQLTDHTRPLHTVDHAFHKHAYMHPGNPGYDMLNEGIT